MICIGIDPGARYTGVSVRNIAEDTILWSSTYVRPDDTEMVEWARTVAVMIQEDVIDQFPGAHVGIENITAPRGYSNGKLSPINPKHLIFAGIVLGAIAMKIPNAFAVPPGKNGSSRAEYPTVLNGRRPKDLPGSAKGAGTRNHEKSAYDVAGEIPFLLGQKNAKNDL